MRRIPVHIITGFLGAGKTTFLNHIIRNRLPERIMVIENECGETNVDGALVMDGVEEVIELSAGCLCCSLSDGLLDVLKEAYHRRSQYDRMIIETTGIADPSSIVQIFLENPAVERAYELQQVICLADAGLVEDWLEETEEALRQISVADVVLCNKADTVTPEYLNQIKEKLSSINPNSLVLGGTEGLFPVNEVLQARTLNPAAVEKVLDESVKQSHVHGENNSHKITTFTLSFSGPLDLNSLQLDLNRLVLLYRHQVYRVKGFIAIPNYPNRVVLQSARSTFIATDGMPWEDNVNREGKLVFIGRGLKKEPFEKMLHRHLSTSKSY